MAHLLGLGLVCDTAITFTQIESFTPWLEKLRFAGELIAPTIFPPDLDSGHSDPNWRSYSEEECLRLLQIAREKERKRINHWFANQLPNIGETVVEAHPGTYLQYGGCITKILGYDFEFINCKNGYAFKEQCVDYPQSFEWGGDRHAMTTS